MPADWCLLSVYNGSVRPSRSKSGAVGDREDGCSSHIVQKNCQVRHSRVLATVLPGTPELRVRLEGEGTGPRPDPDTARSSLLMGAANAAEEKDCHQVWVPYYHKSSPGGYVKEAGIYVFPSENEKDFNFALQKSLYWRSTLPKLF